MMSGLSKKIDLLLLFSVLGLIAMGLVALYSSSHTVMAQGSGTNYFVKQLIWTILGLGLMAFIYVLPPRWIYEFSYLLYGLSIVLLILIFFFGRMGYGATRWLRIGPLLLQPSEMAKLATILALARYISREERNLNELKPFVLAALFPLIPFVLIAKQPDLGTAMVFAAMTLPMFYWAGLKGVNLTLIVIPFVMIFASFNFYAFLTIMIVLLFFLLYSRRSRMLIIFVLILNVVVGLTTPALWNHLKPYQRNRIIVFLDPESDPRGSGYQIIQSKVAIGSGGLTGKGFMQGSQTQLRFLPEQHTDFIYAVIGEEFGFRGVMLGIVLFALFFIRGIQIAASVKNRYNSIVAIGIVTVLLFQTVINMGMTIGLFPVTGLPLPFLSYGGSAMLTNLVMVGLLLNFYRNKFEY